MDKFMSFLKTLDPIFKIALMIIQYTVILKYVSNQAH